MCSPATCPRCGKASYVGCGNHVEQVLAGVPRNKRCSCEPEPPAGLAGMIGRLFGGGR